MTMTPNLLEAACFVVAALLIGTSPVWIDALFRHVERRNRK